jgi:hypothetical protein
MSTQKVKKRIENQPEGGDLNLIQNLARYGEMKNPSKRAERTIFAERKKAIAIW